MRSHCKQMATCFYRIAVLKRAQGHGMIQEKQTLSQETMIMKQGSSSVEVFQPEAEVQRRSFHAASLLPPPPSPIPLEIIKLK